MRQPISRAKFAVVAGLLLAAIIILSGGSAHSFLSIEGLIIVIGGSVANAFLSFEREDVLTAFAAIRNMLDKSQYAREKLQKDVMQLIIWSYVVQDRGFLALEQETAKTIRNPLMRYGIDLVVTGYTTERVREMMHTVVETEFEQRCMPVTVLRNMAATGPAFGMVGTLVGMVMIFQNVGADIAGIGGGLAVAMMSTLYGILMARLICLPAADKMLHKEEADCNRNYMLAEGFAMLADKQNPYYMLDRLNSFLEPSKHFDFNLNTYRQLAARQSAAA